MTTAQHGGASAEALIANNTKTSAIEYLRELIPSRSPSPLPSPLSPLSADITAATDTEVTKEEKEEANGPNPAKSPFKDQPKINYMMAQPSGVTQEGLIRSLKEKVGATHVEIEDMSGGCGQAFSALIVSPQFEKKTTLARHRMVNTALKEEVAAIHAWTPKCYTPEQWEKLSLKGDAPEPAQGKVEGTTA